MAQQEAVCCFYAIGYMVWEDADSSSVPTQKWMSCKFTSYNSTGRCDLQIAMKRAFLCLRNGRHVLRALPANWCLKLDIKLVQVQAEPVGASPSPSRARWVQAQAQAQAQTGVRHNARCTRWGRADKQPRSTRHCSRELFRAVYLHHIAVIKGVKGYNPPTTNLGLMFILTNRKIQVTWHIIGLARVLYIPCSLSHSM